MHRNLLRHRWPGVLLGMLLLAGCVQQRIGTESTLAPAMVLERFLRAANTNDLDTMARLFGNRNGPIVEQASRKDTDDRMFVLASVVRHTDYQILGEEIVPGRRAEATQLRVRLVIAEKQYDVPFIMVRSKQGWLVENVPVEALTNRPGRS